MGSAWDNNLWTSPSLPHKSLLSHIDHPVALTRVDGHAFWVNQSAIEQAGGPASFQSFDSNMCPRDSQGNLTGVFLDSAMKPIYDVIPKPTQSDLKQALVTASAYFNKNGFTHIRDLTCTTEQWNVATQLEDEGSLSLATEEYFACLPYRNFDEALSEALYCRKQKSELRRVKGIKIFFDGALGSEGALVGCCYASGSKGLQLINESDLTEIATQVWQHNLRLAVHIIGDEAAHKVISHFANLSRKNIRGPVDLEHAQMIRPETLDLLPGLDVTAHMQPCHWLSDKKWLSKKLPNSEGLMFPWSNIEKLNVPLFFGSDAPIEAASILLNEKSLQDASEHGIAPPTKLGRFYQSHPDQEWVNGCRLEVREDQVSRLYFKNELIFEQDA